MFAGAWIRRQPQEWVYSSYSGNRESCREERLLAARIHRGGEWSCCAHTCTQEFFGCGSFLRRPELGERLSRFGSVAHWDFWCNGPRKKLSPRVYGVPRAVCAA